MWITVGRDVAGYPESEPASGGGLPQVGSGPLSHCGEINTFQARFDVGHLRKIEQCADEVVHV